MRAFVGTSGFSYAQWKGVFYPPRLKNAEMLEYYSNRLSTVEINNTFYRMPRQALLESWRDRTPEGFRFAIKASRRITHFRKLSQTTELLDHLLSGLGVLGSRLGPLLFQLPPTLRADLELLDGFLEALRHAGKRAGHAQLRAVMEFRHPSWFDAGVGELLERHGVALCGGDGDDEGRVPPPLVRTASFAYVRLRNDADSEEELLSWTQKLREMDVEEAFIYFKHEEQGPFLADRLASLF